MAALVLKQLTENTYIIPSPATMGLWVSGNQATLIDAGNDEDAGRQILRLITERGWNLEMIVCTHSNADHVGGNAFLQKRTGCRIAATTIEASFIEHPLLEPTLLYGGFPMKSLRNKFLMAKPSAVTDRIQDDGVIPGSPLRTMPLPGHFVGMIGVGTPDDVWFVADSLFSEHIIEKYPIFYLYDVAEHLKTLGRLRGLQGRWFVPSHAPHTQDIAMLIDANEVRIATTLDVIQRACGDGGASFDVILERVCSTTGINLDMNQYVLVGSAIRSMLAYLVDADQVEPRIKAGIVLWAARSQGMPDNTLD
jgi:glyoxylase-like metal-dependent hydrolase (beta-lactamase superfamily II)